LSTEPDLYEKMHLLIPPGVKGGVSITHFTVGAKEREWTSLREAITGGREQAVPEGTYVKLTVNGTLMMSDTRMEQLTNLDLIYRAQGDVLIAGLGIGMVIPPLFKKPEVRTVTVVEKSQEVLDLVGPYLVKKYPNLYLVQGDIFTWKPNPSQVFDLAYFDIWPYVCSDNLVDMNRLKRKFKRYVQPNGWLGCWCERECRWQRDRDRRQRARW